jgi:hypothetical protein
MVKPVTVMLPDPAWLTVPVIPPGVLLAVYDNIMEPPLLAGAVNGTVAVLPLKVTVPTVGAPGTTAGMMLLLGRLGVLDP